MLLINNKELPVPGELYIGYVAAEEAVYSGLTSVRALWPGLKAGEMKEILKDTRQSFTLACPDPRTGTERGFTARLRACEAAALGGGMYRLSLTMEEME